MKKAALIACSNGLAETQRPAVERLKRTLRALGVETVESPCLYAADGPWSGTPAARAQVFNDCQRDPSIDVLLDLSGGDLAGELLDLVDYDAICKPLWGYSDLTCLLNAIYAKTGRKNVLYQMRFLRDPETLFTVPVEKIRGGPVEGILAGGNIRCFLKLAGTPYLPDLRDKILLLESYSGGKARISAYLHQLKQMGVFEQVRGILLGTFTELVDKNEGSFVETQLQELTEKPIFKTRWIGHGEDARAVTIGERIRLE